MVMSKYLRDVPPAHFVLKIESFSKLLTSGIESYQSNDFEADGHKWKMVLYPNGFIQENGAGHVSVYVGIADIKSLPPNIRINAYFKMFVHNIKQNKYLTVEELIQGSSRLHAFDKLTPQWGNSQVISHRDLNNPSNGYLINDRCSFGLEVFVEEFTGHGETLSINSLINDQFSSHEWWINTFSQQGATRLWSPQFPIGQHKWKLIIDPKGFGTGSGKSLAFYLQSLDAKNLPDGRTLHAEFNLTVKNQNSSNDKTFTTKYWFSATNDSWGWREFMPLDEVNDVSKGFLVKDTLKVEVKILVTSVSQDHI